MWLSKLKEKREDFKRSELWHQLPNWLTKERGFFGKSWQNTHFSQIQARTLPPTFGLYLVNRIYRHKFGLPLLIVIAISASNFWFMDSEVIQEHLNAIIKDERAKGTFLLALMSAPAIIYTWFIRAYERTLSIQKEEDELWSKELNSLIIQAVNADNAIALRLVAIRQMQDYLNGAKWKANQVANTSAILEAFSSIIDQLEQAESKSAFTLEKPNLYKMQTRRLESRLLDLVGSVMRGAFHIQGDKRVLQVIGNNMSELNLSHLNLESVDFSGLKLEFSKFNYSILDKTNLNNTNLKYAELNYAEINNALLNNAELNNAKLRYAKLNRSKLHRTKLQNAKLNKAHLYKAELKNAQLMDSDLRNVSNLTEEQLIEAMNWELAYRDAELACGGVRLPHPDDE